MAFIKLTPEFAVSAQISPDEMERVRDGGFKAVLCTRPDAEAEGQPEFAAIAEAAQKVGLEARHLPVENGKIGEAELAAFARLIAELPKPVVGYCRTGNRAGMLWTMSAGFRASARKP